MFACPEIRSFFIIYYYHFINNIFIIKYIWIHFLCNLHKKNVEKVKIYVELLFIRLRCRQKSLSNFRKYIIHTRVYSWALKHAVRPSLADSSGLVFCDQVSLFRYPIRSERKKPLWFCLPSPSEWVDRFHSPAFSTLIFAFYRFLLLSHTLTKRQLSVGLIFSWPP